MNKTTGGIMNINEVKSEISKLEVSPSKHAGGSTTNVHGNKSVGAGQHGGGPSVGEFKPCGFAGSGGGGGMKKKK